LIFAIQRICWKRQNYVFAHKKSPAAKMQAGQKSRLAERGPGCEGGACQIKRAFLDLIKLVEML